MFEIGLEWKPFLVKLDKMHRHLKEVCSDYDGMIASETELKVMLTSYNEADIIRVDDYWESLTEQTESELTQYELSQNVKNIVAGAMHFGNELMVEFAAENVMMGITQTGKTKAVADYLADATRYLISGSLYEVVNEVDRLLAEGIPQELAPYVTVERMTGFKQKILGFLG